MNQQFIFVIFLTCPGKDFWFGEGFSLESHSLQCLQSKHVKDTKPKYNTPTQGECLLSVNAELYSHGWHS